MKKLCLYVLAGIFSINVALAQKRTSAIGGGIELGFPTGEYGDYFKNGFGAYGKLMLHLGKAGQFTVTSSYASFKFREHLPGASLTSNLVPILLGYRYNVDGFFFEPQLGYSFINVKFNSEEEGTETEAGGFLSCAGSIGYVFKSHVEISARYQAGGKNGSTANLFGLRLGYNFSLGSSK